METIVHILTNFLNLIVLRILVNVKVLILQLVRMVRFCFAFFVLVIPFVKLQPVLDVEKESFKTRTNNLLNRSLIEVKLESYDLHDSMVNNSKQNKTFSSNSQLLRNIDTFGNLVTGKLFLNFNDSTIQVLLKLSICVSMILQIFT